MKFKQIFFNVIIVGTKPISQAKWILLPGIVIHYQLLPSSQGKYFSIAVSQLLECFNLYHHTYWFLTNDVSLSGYYGFVFKPYLIVWACFLRKKERQNVYSPKAVNRDLRSSYYDNPTWYSRPRLSLMTDMKFKLHILNKQCTVDLLLKNWIRVISIMWFIKKKDSHKIMCFNHYLQY